MICFKIAHHEQWFYYKHVCDFIMEPLPFNVSPFATIFSQVVKISSSQVVFTSCESNSLVVKWKTPYSPIHMNAAFNISSTWHVSESGIASVIAVAVDMTNSSF